jgi:hypothetical protein
MAEIALPRQQVTQALQSTGVGSPLYQRRQSNTAPIELLPNPDFTFPMRADRTSSEPSTSTLNARPMSLQAYPAGRRGSTPGRMRQKSVNTLPDFSFNPAGTAQPPVAASSPPHSPFTTSPTTASRPIGGHRRGGSEFIGGDARAGGLLSTSPSKGAGVLPPPTNLRPGPPAGRRGHVHRRSGAVSSHDLSTMMKPPSSQADSAPVTPLEGPKFVFGHSVNKSMSQPSLRGTALHEDMESTPRPPSRARVGFSDKVEYIRPLSTISSETETSLSTFRGHSATNSLSSVISASTASPGRGGRHALSPTRELDARPNTAGAILDIQKKGYLGADLPGRQRPSSAFSLSPNPSSNSPTVQEKRRSFFRLDSRRSDFPDASGPTVAVELDSPPFSCPTGENGECEDDTDKVKTRKSSSTPRKVKSWASSIIPKKTKHSKKGKGRAPTPPTQSGADMEDTDESEDLDFDAIFDVDNTVTIVSPTEGSFPEQKPQTDYASWQPRELKRVDSDVKSPVIDLDAALGPFNTPQGSSPVQNQRGFAAHRRAMHSAGGILQTHRRTESAPELVPFEMRTSTLPATSAMADVFEEDEPEEQTCKTSAEATEIDEENAEDPKIQVVETDSLHHGTAINWNFEDGLGIKRTEKTHKTQPYEPASPATIEEEVRDTEQSAVHHPVEVVEDFEEPRTSSLTHSSDSTVTPPVPAEDTKEMFNLSLRLSQENLMTPDTFTSSLPSSDFRSSQNSLDTPRLGTATSSMTDYPVMPSPRFGEPGPELRISVDDVPSLTSSRSTMTSSAMQSAFPLHGPRRPGDRSASLCSDQASDADSHRRKRSSIASLSRLINNSSFGERSKLSNEVRPQSEYLEPTHKETKKKHKRLSKLMQFWKPKDSSRT